MKKEEIRKIMKENFEEVDREYWLRDNDETFSCRFPTKEGDLFFKPKQEFPIIIDMGIHNIKILNNLNAVYCDGEGELTIFNGNSDFERWENFIAKMKELRK